MLNDPITKRELEKMRSKMHKISAQLLASKLEYCLENFELRQSMMRMRDFSINERKLEAVQYMTEIIDCRKKLSALVQWVRAIYSTKQGKLQFEPDSSVGRS